MGKFREWLVRLWGTVRPRRHDADLEEELRFHLELTAEVERRHETSADLARRAAVLRSGALAPSMDALRDQRGLPALGALAREARHAVRAFRREPAFTAAALATFTLGIGASTAMFSVVNAVLLRPLPYPDAERLVAVWQKAPGAEGLTAVSGDLRLSGSMFFTYAEHNRVFEHMGVWYAATAAVTGTGEPHEVRTLVVSNGVLEALGVAPLAGRWLTHADQQPEAARTALLSDGYWQRRLGGNPHVLGRTIVVDSMPVEIVGIMPRGFGIAGTNPEIILPIRFNRARQTLPGFGFQGVARLKPGVTVEDANADLTRLVPVWMNSWPAPYGVNPRVYENWRIAAALRPLKEDVVGNAGRSLWVLMATSGIVLLIACANVATLLLVRGDARQHELAIRAALGAGAGQIVRVLLVESLLLSATGGLLGLGLAATALDLLVAYGPATLPRLTELSLDARVVVFALAVSLMSGLLFGLIPAWRRRSIASSPALRGSSRAFSEGGERQRARSALVVGQIALSLVLLVCSGLMLRTSRALHSVDTGLTDPASLQTMRVAVPRSLAPDPDGVARLQQAMVERVAALPGVSAVAFAAELPMEGVPPDWDIVLADGVAYAPREIPPLRLFEYVSPGYFHAVGTRIVAGRDYTWTDVHERRRFVIVSENVARELWGTPQAALGKRIQTLPSAPWREVIGVAQDVRHNGVQESAPAIVYWPSAGESAYRPEPTATRTLTFVVRSPRAGAEALVREIQQAIWKVNGNVSIASVRTLQDIYERSLARTSFTLVMLALSGAMALLLGVVGIYGLITYGVSRRRREIGIRLAVGAQRAEVTGMFLRSGLVLAAIGVPIGLAASAVLTRLMSSLLYGVTPLDGPTYVATPLVVLAAAVLASWVPARRAAAVDPMEALKVE